MEVNMYKKVSTDINFVDREKQTEKFWEDNDIFRKSMRDREGNEIYMFYDGPPTANGKPHIGHVLTRVIKDMIPRYRTMKITDEFLVKGYYRNYDGMHLLKHALHNTCPDMMKSIGKDEHGNDIKMRDSEGIQLANAKIDEIRNGFSEWLEEQSPQFKERLVTMYNRKFNCFVRPRYDGSHQTFPDLNLKGLASRGIKSVYPSQMDCVWMLKQNGGGICDHEVLRP